MRQTIRLGIVVTVVAFATASWAEVQTIYRATDLGTLGGSYSQACDINENGQVVGYSYVAGDAAYRGFVWDKTNGMAPLGTLGGTNSYAYGLNNLGQVVGKAQIPGNSNDQAFVWDQTGGMVNLGCINGVNRYSVASDINDAGLICGTSQIHHSWDRWRATLWDDTGPNDLGTLGGSYSDGAAINEGGKITGSAQTWLSPADWHPHRVFVWTDQTGMVSLGAPVGSYRSRGVDINEAGWVAGLSGREGQGVEAKDAAMWDPSGNLTYLPFLGGDDACAYGINDAVQVVGRSETAGGEYHAFLYEDGQMIDLNDLLLPGSGWDYLEDAREINERGQIVGLGLIGGETHGFLMEQVIRLEIDIRPKQDINRVNLHSKGPVPLAILGCEDLDVTQIDLASLALAGSTPRETGKRGVADYDDINSDGFLDLILKFTASELQLDPGATEAMLTGSLLDGTEILGSDLIRLLPPGDANEDGLTNLQDFTILKSNFGQKGKLDDGDFNEDGTVNLQDFTILKSNFGQGAGGVATVPGPATLSLLGVAAVAILRRRRLQPH